MATTRDGGIWCASRQLSPQVVLNVHLVTGPTGAVFVDSGIAPMFDDLLALVSEAGKDLAAVRLVLNTHSHHDHIGCNGRLKAATGCLVAAPAAFAHWHTDFQLQYEEFANSYRDVIADDPDQRVGILSTLDVPHPVDLNLTEGSRVLLGDGMALACMELPGHMTHEVGFLEEKSGTLLLGDVLTGTTWSFFHGYVDVGQYRATLACLAQLMGGGTVHDVRPAHYPRLTPQQGGQVVAAIVQLTDDVETEIIDIVGASGQASTADVWQELCQRMQKNHDFRAMNVVTAHLRDLVAKGALYQTATGEFVSQ